MLIKIIFLLISVFATTSFGEEHECRLTFDTCSMRGLFMTESDYTIVPVTKNLSGIGGIHLEGVVPVMVGGWCDLTPNLRDIQASSLAMEVLKASAFRGCHKLRNIFLYQNKFKEIEKDSFKGLTEMLELEIDGGSIPVFDIDLSDMKKIKVLKITVLNVSELSADTFREHKDLEELHLFSNNLFDLDVEKILENSPKMKIIYLGDNNFKCSRLQTILSLLKEKNIEVGKNTFHDYLRVRNYETEQIDGIHCINDELWSELHSKHSTIPK